MNFINMNQPRFLMCLLFFLICCKSEKEPQDQNQDETTIREEIPPIEVGIEVLDSIDFYQEIISNGKLEGHQKSEMRFKINQKITNIYVSNGQYVQKGQLLARLDNYELENSLLLCKVSLENGKLTLMDYLIGQGYALKDSVDIPENILSIAKIKSGYTKAEMELALAQFNMEQTILRAASNGFIANLTVKESNYPDGEKPFCLIIDNSKLEIRFPVMEPEAHLVEKGRPVNIVLYYNEKEISGRVSAINPFIDENGQLEVTAIIAQPGTGLYEGMNAKVYLKKNIGKALAVPKEAVTLRSERPVVFVYENGLAKWNYVELGEENSSQVVVKTELVQGDSIIVKGNLHLAHESKVLLTL